MVIRTWAPDHFGAEPKNGQSRRSDKAARGSKISSDLPASIRVMALSVEEREQFLAEPHVGAVSVVERSDRAPLTVPIWYQYSPGGELWIYTAPGARKTRAIEAAGRFSLMVQRTEPTMRYVSVEGPVVRTSPGSGELSRQMAARYVPPDKLADYLEFERTQLGEHIAIYMRPEHWLSSDLGAL